MDVHVVLDDGKLITDAIRRALNVKAGPFPVRAERGRILAFSRAIQDPNPLWNDELAARKSRYGGLIAAPTFVLGIKSEQWEIDNVANIDCPLRGFLLGSVDLQLFEPVRADDTITVTHELTGAKVKEGRAGKMVFLTAESVYSNQFGEVVAKQIRTTIRVPPISF